MRIRFAGGRRSSTLFKESAMSKPMHFGSLLHDSDATLLIQHLSQLQHPHVKPISSVSMVSIYGIARSPLFALGQIVTTDSAANLLRHTQTELLPLLLRHQCGDWGMIDARCIAVNEAALHYPSAIESVYVLGMPQEKLCIVTSGDRAKTTAMLPGENVR